VSDTLIDLRNDTFCSIRPAGLREGERVGKAVKVYQMQPELDAAGGTLLGLTLRALSDELTAGDFYQKAAKKFPKGDARRGLFLQLAALLELTDVLAAIGTEGRRVVCRVMAELATGKTPTPWDGDVARSRKSDLNRYLLRGLLDAVSADGQSIGLGATVLRFPDDAPPPPRRGE
jgi:hypothetical protein